MERKNRLDYNLKSNLSLESNELLEIISWKWEEVFKNIKSLENLNAFYEKQKITFTNKDSSSNWILFSNKHKLKNKNDTIRYFQLFVENFDKYKEWYKWGLFVVRKLEVIKRNLEKLWANVSDVERIIEYYKEKENKSKKKTIIKSKIIKK